MSLLPYLRVFHISISSGRRDLLVSISAAGSRLPEGIGPTSVVREHPLPNGSGSFGKYARTSDDPELQG